MADGLPQASVEKSCCGAPRITRGYDNDRGSYRNMRFGMAGFEPVTSDTSTAMAISLLLAESRTSSRAEDNRSRQPKSKRCCLATRM